MDPRRRNAMTTQMLQSNRVGFLRADQSQPLLLRCLDGRFQFLGGARQALAVDART